VALALAAAALILLVDQLTKLLMLRRDGSIQFRAGESGGGVVVSARPGLVALPARVAAPLWIAVASGAIAVLIALPAASPAVAVGIGLGIGGGLSNLVDRLGRGGVVDFIAIWRWPPFNIADAGLVAGLGLVAIAVL
jgi:lipoprotein signal peptidase